MLAEPFVAPKLDGEDETLAAFASRRLGEEAMEKIIAPVLAGIYNADPQLQSILTTSPVMREMETQHGSLVRAMVARMRAGRRKKAAAPGRPRFFTFKNGAGELTDRLAAQLSGDLRLGAQAVAIRPLANGFRIQLQNGEFLETGTVLLAAPANVATQLLEAVSAAAAAALAGIRHTSIGTAFLIFPSDALRPARPINGLMIPPREGRLIDAVTFPFNKMPERAPQGYTAVRVFYGRSVPEMVDHTSESLQKLICGELDTLFGIRAAPAGIETFSWKDSFPQADVGHLERVAEIRALLPHGVYVAGASYAGVGVPDCVHSGRQAAQDWWRQHGPGRNAQAGSTARVVENQLEEKILHS
jgi:oxygen-dependent protoporphyrinogen oxidase